MLYSHYALTKAGLSVQFWIPDLSQSPTPLLHNANAMLIHVHLSSAPVCKPVLGTGATTMNKNPPGAWLSGLSLSSRRKKQLNKNDKC